MIDIHTHILPGVDDGAQHLQESLELARAAVAEGITGVIATPHHRNGRYLNEAENVTASVLLLQEALREENIPLQVKTGQEIRVYPELLDDLAAGKLLTLGDSPYLLLEFPAASVPNYAQELVFELTLQGKIPVIAHPERNAELARQPDQLKKMTDMGAYGQVTSHSLNGKFGRSIQKTALRMLHRNLVHLVSSDAHHLQNRSFSLQEAYRQVEKEVGAAPCQIIMSNAAKIWNGEHMTKVWDAPVKTKRTFSFLRQLMR